MTPETIYLIPGEEIEGTAPGRTWSWGVDPAPSYADDPAEAVEYVRKDKHDERVGELETMVKVFRGCIETGVMPKQGSPCHKIINMLVGERDND